MRVRKASLPYARDSDTSFEAAESMREPAAVIRSAILRAVVASHIGLTCDEAEVKLHLTHQTCSARFTELHQAGLILKTEQRRLTRGNRNAVVYVGSTK